MSFFSIFVLHICKNMETFLLFYICINTNFSFFFSSFHNFFFISTIFFYIFLSLATSLPILFCTRMLYKFQLIRSLSSFSFDTLPFSLIFVFFSQFSLANKGAEAKKEDKRRILDAIIVYWVILLRMRIVHNEKTT